MIVNLERALSWYERCLFGGRVIQALASLIVVILSKTGTDVIQAKDADSCPLYFVWLVGFMVLSALDVACMFVSPRWEELPLKGRVGLFAFYLLLLSWEIVGSVWIFSQAEDSPTCPLLYQTSLAILCFEYAAAGLPIAVCLVGGLVLCCVIASDVATVEITRRRRGPDRQPLIDRLPTEIFQVSADQREDARQCSICLVEYEHGTSELRVLPCAHRFHKTCVDQWFQHQTWCPLCRRSIEDSPV